MMSGFGLVACACALSGCYAEADGTIPPPEYAYGYAPVYDNGYVVYYDDVGRPFYYGDHGAVWVFPNDPLYPGLVAHWHTFGPAYHRWYAHGGDRFRAYHFHGHRR